MSTKSEEPTPRRLRKAREEGDSPTSAFATQACAFMAAVALGPPSVAALASRASADLRSAVAHAAAPDPFVAFDAASVGGTVALLSAPILTAAFVAAAASSVVQSGGVISARRLTPKLARVNLAQGFANLGSTARLAAVARAALYAGAVMYFAYASLRAHTGDLARAAGRPNETTAVAVAMAQAVAMKAGLFGIAVAVVDVVVTRAAFRRRHRMTREEVKREHKESEGDPQIKAARERARRDMVASAGLQNVSTASVVVVGLSTAACALRYSKADGDVAPVVLMSGRGELAERIAATARACRVAVVPNAKLADALAELEIGVPIPEAHYDAVAEALREARDA